MYLQESSKAKNKRLIRKALYRFFMITFTAMLYAIDVYIIFSTGITSVQQGDIDISLGPLFTRVCKKTKCNKVLFYQVPIDDYLGTIVQGSANIMLAIWIPIFVGVIATRILLWRIHPLLQTAVSIGYSGLLYVLNDNSYVIGTTIYVIITRGILCLITTCIIAVITIIRAMALKFCPDVSDMPVLVGLSWNTEHDDEYSDDLMSQQFYEPKKMSLDESEDCSY